MKGGLHRDDIVKYTRPLNNISGLTSARVQSEPLAADAASVGKKKRAATPHKPEKVRRIEHEAEIASALQKYKNEKLISLYHSITTIDLDPHTPIVAVGVWSFFETLTSCAGRNNGTSLAGR